MEASAVRGGGKRSSINAGSVSIPGVEEVVQVALFGEEEEDIGGLVGEEEDEVVLPAKKFEDIEVRESRGSGGSDRASRSERTSSSVSIPRVEDVVEAGLTGAVEDLGLGVFGQVERKISEEASSAKERPLGFVQERPASTRVSIPKLEEVVAVGLTGAVEDLGPQGRGRVSTGRGQAFQGAIGSTIQGEEGQSSKEHGQSAKRVVAGGPSYDPEDTEPVPDPVQFEDLIEPGNTEEDALGLAHGAAVRIESESIEERSESEAEMEAPLEEAAQAVETVAMTKLIGEDPETEGKDADEEVVEEIVEEEVVDEEVADEEVVDREIADEELVAEEVVDEEVVDGKVVDEVEEEEHVDDEEGQTRNVESEVVEAVEERTVELSEVGMEASTSVEPAEYSEDKTFSGQSNVAAGQKAVEDVTAVVAEASVVAETAASAIAAEAGAVSANVETTTLVEAADAGETTTLVEAADAGEATAVTGAATAAADKDIEPGSKRVEDDAVHEAIEEAKSAAAIAVASTAETPKVAPESMELTGEAKPRSSVKTEEVLPIAVSTSATAPAGSSEIVPAAASEEAREGETEESEAQKEEEEEEDEEKYQTPAVRLVSMLLKLKDQVEGYVNMLKAAIAEKQGNRAVMLRSLRIAARSGLVSCQVKLGDKLLYGQGVGVEFANPEEGAEWHLKAAEKGVVRSQLIAADCYLQGVGLEKDPAEVDRLLGALNWEKIPESINKNQLGVMCYQLSQIYMQGKIQLTKSKFRDYPKDDERCFTWTKRAAGLGNMTAVAQLASLYDQGVGCEESQELAFVNWKRAAIGGELKCVRFVCVLTDVMRKYYKRIPIF
uniref:Uncharacterized protein n=1 Tax=Rhodosorus marinus TaxID=101924 RepID=A0A7S2ZI68_9RHOD|mmetsp:Transcript_19348/g.77349  ORF Transcript_19348/g.77349 Transcript_19348/m.77349 type:complete len:835 (+) Transcript_19348:117-2621(+)